MLLKHEVVPGSQLGIMAMVNSVLAICSIPVSACIALLLPALLSFCSAMQMHLHKAAKISNGTHWERVHTLSAWQGMSCGYIFGGGVALLPSVNEHCWLHSQSIAHEQGYGMLAR